MMKALRILHTAYGLFVFAVLFVPAFILLLYAIVFPSRYRWVGVVNRAWARVLFLLCFLPVRVRVSPRIDRNRQYLFCPNHFSYLDIPTMGLNPVNAVFVGKNDMEKIPLFGFMYRKLHITVNRASLRSRSQTLRRSLLALDEGKSLVIYPEGGIVTTDPPRMAPFKDGAFRAAIEKKVPIVPVTIPYNWKRMPDTPWPLLHAGRVDVVFHDPIETQELTLADIDELKQKVFSVIDHELQQQR
ncbi:MAG: 1-acyl-sn-glycerol-3-phosphate acyltransferase [Cyclobacteriaceae bacterium]|jgi:1-acyl-sn-glycerol-3-phosphate acyltransferase|nr:1-acyl-sn-glycerol-3-phosphate acyltransferase [Cyclobacteriaceae bacterium]